MTRPACPALPRPLVAVLVTLLVAAAAGCVSIPESSPVYEGRDVGVENDPQQVRINVTGPTPGADREAIVQGFYQAMLAYPQNVPVAREFLTTQAAGDWDPGAAVVVYRDVDIASAASGDEVVVTGRALGSVDERGSWTSAVGERAALQTTLRLRSVDGQWRITNPQPGILIDPDYFDRNYDDYSLYFFDPTRQVLTPDPVYLAVGETTATALVRDMLLGPTSELTGVAETIAAQTTEVDVAVAISADGVAEVPLSDEVLRLSPEDRQLFGAQVTWTLRQLGGIQWISITVDGAPLEIPNVDDTFGIDEYAGFDPAGLAGERRLFAFDREGVVAVSPVEVTAILGPLGSVRPGSSLAISASGEIGAVVRGNGDSVVVAGLPSASELTPQTWFAGGTAVLRPSWDLAGVLWLVDRTPTGARIYAVTEERVREVRAAGLTGEDIASFAVSRDGVRFAAVIGTGEDSRLDIATIDRAPKDGRRVTLGSPREVRSPLVDLIDLTQLAWVSPTSIAILGNELSDDRQPFEVAIDGSRTVAAEGFLPVMPLTIAAGPNTDAPIAIGTAGGAVYVQTLDGWTPFTGDAKLLAPVYPG